MPNEQAVNATEDSQEDADALVEQQMLEALAKEEAQEEQEKSPDGEAEDADALVEQQMLEALAKEEAQEEQEKSPDGEAEDADALVEQQMLEALAKEGSADDSGAEPMAGNILSGEPGSTVKPALFQSLSPADQDAPPKNIEMLMDVTLVVSIELGRTTMQVKRILELGPGSVIELNKMAGEPVDVLVNNKLIARGEVVVVDENFGIRVTDLISPSDRLKSL
ncbi:MAG: flagellar motor switch protein FliN [Candidatus Latescibacteria bacterium]|nr:flagellar motor switch protein FliN [Candidatus Latescibacterota bacterium]